MKLKRLFNILPFFFLLIGIIILCYDFLQKDEIIDLKIYALDTYNEYQRQDDNIYSLTYYINDKLKVDDYYIIVDNKKILLNIVNTTYSNTYYNNELFYIVHLSFFYDQEADFKDCILELNTNDLSYRVKVGDIKINYEEDEDLIFNYLEGHYSYVNNNLLLVGISFKFNNNYHISSAKINDNVFLQLEYASILDDKLDNIIDFDSKNIFNPTNKSIDVNKDNIYFIPVGYKKLENLGAFNLRINDKLYNIINLMVSDKLLDDYKGFINEAILC